VTPGKENAYPLILLDAQMPELTDYIGRAKKSCKQENTPFMLVSTLIMLTFGEQHFGRASL